jgi:hypothetical protein
MLQSKATRLTCAPWDDDADGRACSIPLVAGAFEVEWSFRRRRTLGVQAEDEEGKGRSILDSSQAGHPQGELMFLHTSATYS